MSASVTSPPTPVPCKDGEVDAELTGQAMESKRFEGLRADDRDHRLRRGLCSRRRRDGVKELLATPADHRQGRPHGRKLSLSRDDPQDDPGHRRSDFDGRLLGLDLDDRLMLFDRVPFRDEPSGDLPFGETLSQIGQCEGVGHGRQRSRERNSRPEASLVRSTRDVAPVCASRPAIERTRAPERLRHLRY